MAFQGADFAALSFQALSRAPPLEAESAPSLPSQKCAGSSGSSSSSSTAYRSAATCQHPGGRGFPWLSPKKPHVSWSNHDVAKWRYSALVIGAGGPFVVGPGGMHAALAGTPAPPQPTPDKSGAKPWQIKVLVLMSNTGGGHRASAEALKAGFQELYGDKYHLDIVDAWKDHTPSPFNQMPDQYSFLVSKPILWRITYMSQQPRIIHKPYLWSCGHLIGHELNELFAQYNPDLVVSVHPLMQHIPIRVLQQRIRKGLSPPISFATVVTDFTTCSNLWFHRGTSKCFVPTEYCAKRARLLGLHPDQIVVHGLPIRPAFSHRHASKAVLRRRLGLDRTLPAVLVVGGGEGMGKLQETVAAISDRGTPCQVVVVCGRNEVLREGLQNTTWGPNIQVHPFGFVTNMHEFMFCCDAVVTKAGPGTIAEALICGLPILLNGNVPCQEEGNVSYVVDNGCGAFERNPVKIADILHEWFTEEGHYALERMSLNARALGRPDALLKIVRDLAAMSNHEERAGATEAIPSVSLASG